MDNNSFWINLIAKLKKDQSKQQIKTDVKSLGDIFIRLTGKLDLVKTRKNINSQLKDLNNNTFTITPTVNKKRVQNATKQAVDNAQKTANSNKVKIDFEVNKQKLINQIKILGRDNSKLFNNSEISAKYNQLLDSAKIAKSSSELKSLRGQLSAFRTELKATKNDGMKWIDKFKSSISSFAQYFSGASFIYAMTNQLKNAWTEAKTLDDRLVDLQKVTDEIADRDALYKYFDRAMSKAQELNVKVDSLLYAITEFKKLGWSLSDAELGGQWATILENVGDVNIDTAIGSIKTAIASFDEIGGFGNEQIDKKIEAYVDLINNMSNKFSIDAEGLSEAIRLSAGTLREAHTSIEEAATIFATANRYYNDPNYLGNTLKIGSLRMRASSGDSDAISELEEMGEQIDDLAEATSNLRGQLLALTGVDIMVDEHTFKSYYDQLYEISQVIDDLNDTSRANVLETLFGKNRSAAGAAILSGMKESTDAYEEAINSAGSATKEYETWMQSADAATQRFANNLTQMYQSIVNGNTVRDLSNLGSAVLEFANNLGIVEGTLKGVIVLGLGKFFTTSTMAIITATKSVEQYGRALQLANNIPDGNLATRYKTLRDIAQATSLLTDAQKKQVLSSQLLSEQDRIRILSMQNMTKEIAAQKLAEMGLTNATNAQTAANTASTASTFSLKAAMTGLGATIKSVFLSNPIGISLMAISVAISAVTSAVSKHNQKMEEMREKAKEAADKANTLGDEIAELASKYISLSEAVKTDASAKEDLISTQTELLKKLGLEGEGIDSLIEKYGSLSNAIRQVSIDSLKDAQIDLIAGVNAAKDELLKAGANGFWGGNNIINATGDDAVKAFKELEKAGIVGSGSYGSGGGALVLIGDDKTTEGILENYKRLEDALRALRDSNAFTANELSDNSLYQAIYGRYSEMKDSVESYKSAIADLNENLAQQTMLTALQGNEIPKTEETFESFRQELIDTAIASQQFIGNEKEIADAVNNYLATVSEFAGFYSIPLENELSRVETLLGKTFDITTYKDSIDDFQSQMKTLGDALSSIQSGVFEDSDLTDLLQEFPELADKTDDLETAIVELINNALQALYATLGENIPDGLKTSLQDLADIASGTAKHLGDAFSDIHDSWDILHDFKKTMDKGFDSNVTDNLLQSVRKLSGELETLVAGYYSGVVTAEQLYEALTEHYENDLHNYSEALIKKNELNEGFYNAVGLADTEVVNQFNDNYGVDLENCKTYADAKARIELDTLDTISTAWSKYYDAQSKTFTREYKILEAQATHGGGAPAELLDEINGKVAAYEAAMEALNNITYDGIRSNFEGIGSKLSSNSGSSSSSSSDFEETFDWIETAIDRIERSISNLDLKASSVYRSWSERNSNLKAELIDVKKEMDIQASGYNKYMQQANSVGLSEEWVSKVRNGQIDINSITDKTLAKRIKEYQDWYEKAIDCQDAIEELRESVSKLYETAFDNIVSQFDSIVSVIENSKSMLDEQINQAEERGYIANVAYYEALIKVEQKNIEQLTKERTSLQSALADAVSNGAIAEGSQEWADMSKQIDDVTLSIEQANTAMIKYGNSIRDIQWQIFDLIQDRISRISSESDFLINLLSYDKQYNDNGQLTDTGMSTVGLHGMNYNVYMAQADKYAQEMLRINEELAKDPNNLELYNRKAELIELQQESIIAAENEKQAIVDMVEEGIKLELDAIQSLISSYEDALSAQKD